MLTGVPALGAGMTYDEAIRFWSARANYEVKAAAPADLKLERMRAVLARLGDPHDAVHLVHVTGTKGKGSVAAMLAAVLRAAGHRTGLFTSPHLTCVEERIQIDGVPIPPGELAALMGEVAPAVLAEEAGGGPGVTFFEIITALGFLHFVRQKADIAVIEVGLGGRFDSTNVCSPLVSVVTSVGSDHTAQLGDTLEAIAFQKAGILKPDTPAVSGVTQPGPRAVVERVAREVAAPLWQVGPDVRYANAPAPRPGSPVLYPVVTVSTPAGPHPPLAVGLLGEHQAANAAVAVAALDRLRACGVRVPDAAIAAGLRGVVWPARVEVVRERPWVVVDSAHNEPSVEALVNALRDAVPVAGRKACVFAVSADKAYRPMLAALAGYFDHFHLTAYGSNPRRVPPAALAAALAEVAPHRTADVHPTASEALDAALALAGADDLVCVTGSVFLAGELRDRATRG